MKVVKNAGKIFFLIAVVIISNVNVSFSAASNSDSSISTMVVSLNVQNESLEVVLRQIEKQTGVNILLDAGFELAVTIVCEQVPLQQALSRVLPQDNYIFVYDDTLKVVTILTLGQSGTVTDLTSRSEALKKSYDTIEPNSISLTGADKGNDFSGDSPMSSAVTALDEFKQEMNAGNVRSRQSEASPMQESAEAMRDFKDKQKN